MRMRRETIVWLLNIDSPKFELLKHFVNSQILSSTVSGLLLNNETTKLDSIRSGDKREYVGERAEQGRQMKRINVQSIETGEKCWGQIPPAGVDREQTGGGEGGGGKAQRMDGFPAGGTSCD